MPRERAEKSKKILETLKKNVESFQNLFEEVDDELTKQNILRSIILFSCSGIDAIVKQLIHESLGEIIERDQGAQRQFKDYVKKRLKKDIEGNGYELLADCLTAESGRKYLKQRLINDLSFDSLQSPDQLYKVASHFNITTDKIVSKENREVIKRLFNTRNTIVHQMDIEFDKPSIDCYTHNIDEVNEFYKTIITVAQNYIHEVDVMLEKDKTTDSSLAPIDDEISM